MTTQLVHCWSKLICNFGHKVRINWLRQEYHDVSIMHIIIFWTRVIQIGEKNSNMYHIDSALPKKVLQLILKTDWALKWVQLMTNSPEGDVQDTPKPFLNDFGEKPPC